MTENLIITALDILCSAAHQNAINKGFVIKNERRNPGELLALIHSELSECLEAIRSGQRPDKDCPNFTNEEIELADAVIRICDMCAERNYRLGEAIIAKMTYNSGRPHRHGKRF